MYVEIKYKNNHANRIQTYKSNGHKSEFEMTKTGEILVKIKEYDSYGQGKDSGQSDKTEGIFEGTKSSKIILNKSDIQEILDFLQQKDLLKLTVGG